MTAPVTPSLRAEADTETIADLVGHVRRGVVRIPSFQRGLRWDADDVLALFDSVFRGYPIGSLLLRKGPAQADRIQIGPLAIDAPATESALWVIDGQQRLTALTVGLARTGQLPTAPEDPYVVYFDAAAEKFTAPRRDGAYPSTWVPVNQLLDSSVLTEWIFNWTHASDARLRRAVFLAGSRIREYRVPLYVVDSADEQLLRDIFYRINNYGKSLEWDEVHDALFGQGGQRPSTMRELADDLMGLGMGRPDEAQLLPSLLAFKGLDVTRSLADHYRRDRDVLRGAVSEAVPALKQTLLFLRRHAQVPHLRLLPRSTPLPVLVRFFAVYPEPSPRSNQLLTRWTWRALLAGASYDERTLLRHGVAQIVPADEEGVVQRLLKLLPVQSTAKFSIPQRFDARGADSRIVLLALASLEPVDLRSGQPINVAAQIAKHGIEAFRKVVRAQPPLVSSPANRVILPGLGLARIDIDRALDEPSGVARLATHAICGRALVSYRDGDMNGFVVERAKYLDRVIDRLTKRLAGWARSDRPSIPYLLESVDD